MGKKAGKTNGSQKVEESQSQRTGRGGGCAVFLSFLTCLVFHFPTLPLSDSSTLLRSSRLPISARAHSVPVGNTLADTELLPDAIEGLSYAKMGIVGRGRGGRRFSHGLTRIRQETEATEEGEDLATDWHG